MQERFECMFKAMQFEQKSGNFLFQFSALSGHIFAERKCSAFSFWILDIPKHYVGIFFRIFATKTLRVFWGPCNSRWQWKGFRHLWSWFLSWGISSMYSPLRALEFIPIENTFLSKCGPGDSSKTTISGFTHFSLGGIFMGEIWIV